MGARFVHVDRDTIMLLPPSTQEWVDPDDMVHIDRLLAEAAAADEAHEDDGQRIPAQAGRREDHDRDGDEPRAPRKKRRRCQGPKTSIGSI